MKFNSPKIVVKNRGQIIQSVIILLLSLTISGGMGLLTVSNNRSALKKKQDIEYGASVASGIETMLLAYRIAEVKYIKRVGEKFLLGTCNSANPFLQALKEGSGCSGVTNLKVFTGSDSATQSKLYTYTGACTINSGNSDCAEGNQEILNMGFTDPTQKMGDTVIRIFLSTIQPEKGFAEFTAWTKTDAFNYDLKRSFAIRPILPNAAYYERTDGSILQEISDPLTRCPGTAWGNLSFFNKETRKCNQFAQLGGAKGLAFYRDRYFSFEPNSGEVKDIQKASTSPSAGFTVNPTTGKIPGGTEAIFPPYSDEDLAFKHDITLIDKDIYYVGGNEYDSHIGVLDSTDGLKGKPVCQLGPLGFGRPISGIAALSWSDSIIRPAGQSASTDRDRLAVFFLKGATEELITITIALAQGETFPGTCVGFVDKNRVAWEYPRFAGFDRTADSKPYFIY